MYLTIIMKLLIKFTCKKIKDNDISSLRYNQLMYFIKASTVDFEMFSLASYFVYSS